MSRLALMLCTGWNTNVAQRDGCRVIRTSTSKLHKKRVLKAEGHEVMVMDGLALLTPAILRVRRREILDFRAT
jgi:hypothetical protein